MGAATGEVLMFEGGEARGSVLVAGGLRLTCMLAHLEACSTVCCVKHSTHNAVLSCFEAQVDAGTHHGTLEEPANKASHVGDEPVLTQ